MRADPLRERSWRLLLFLRPVFLALLGIVAVVVLVYFLTHLRRQAGIGPIGNRLTPQKVEVQEDARYLEFNRDLGRMEIRGDRNYLGKDGRYHLEGKVEIVDRGRKGGRDLRIRADRALYDKDWTKADFIGNVTIESRGLRISADKFIYDKSKDLFRSARGAKMQSERFTGKAQALSYSLTDETVDLEGNLVFDLKPRADGEEPMSIKSRRLLFNYPRRRGRFEGEVKYKRGSSRGQADVIEIQLFSENDELQVLWLMGGVKAHIREETSAGGGPPPRPKAAAPEAGLRQPFVFGHERQDMDADQLLLVFYEENASVNVVRSRGQASFLMASSQGDKTRVRGDALNAYFRKDGTLGEMSVRGRAGIEGKGEPGRSDTILEGDAIYFEGSTRILKSFGSPGRQSHLDFQGRSVNADWIVFFTQNNNTNASGKVTMVQDAKPAGEAASGFFDSQKPLSARAGFMGSNPAEHKLVLRENINLWQGQQVLEAKEVVVRDDTQALEATGGVTFSFVQAPKPGKPEERVQLSGERMKYDPESRRVTFTGKGRLQVRDIDLSAPTLTVVPGAEPGKAERILASDGVKVLQGQREATGEEADYDTAGETIALTGRPVLNDKEKGIVRGDKLTFRMADGNIHVENKDQERSLVIIKS